MTTFSLARIAMAVKYGERNRHAREEDGKDHPEPGGDQVVRDGGDGGEFHTGLVASAAAAVPGCAFEECELNAACAA